MIKKCTALILALCMVLSLYSASAYATVFTGGRLGILGELTDQFWGAVNSEHENVLFVKGATSRNYPDVTYGDAFDSFFAYPTWKYFEGTVEKTNQNQESVPDSSEEVFDIVEFTGYCTYRGTDVKVRLQFQLNLEEGTFSPRALSFNDVPQSSLIMALLLEKVFESAAGEATPEEVWSYMQEDDAFNQEDEHFYYSEVPIGLDELSGVYSGESGELYISMYTSLESDGSVGEAQIILDDAEYDGTIYSYGTNLYGVITEEGEILYLGADIGAHGICMCVQMYGYTVGEFTMTERYES